MSFVKKIATVAFSAVATFTLTTFVAGQDNNSSDNQTEKPSKERRWGRGDGDGFRGKGMRGGRGGFGMRGLRGLDLTDAQREQIRGIMETSKTANQPIFEELKALKEKRRGGEELSATDISRLKELKAQMQQSREQTENTVLGILTADQRQKLEQQKLERQQRREEFRQRRQQNRQNVPTTLDKNDGE